MKFEKVLSVLESKGYQAFIVGGYVRNSLLNIRCSDVDIITNATPEEIVNIFKKEVVKIYDKFGAVKLKNGSDVLDITTFRKELSYEKGKPKDILFVDNLLNDLIRRDFTINAICMDVRGNIIDPLNGVKDLELKIIKTIRDVKVEFIEDPSRLLRAIRFMSEFNLALDSDIENYIINNKEEFSKITYDKRKEELDKLFKSGSSKRFFDYIKEKGLEEHLGISVCEYKETNKRLGVWSQINYSDNYNFTKYERKYIRDVKFLLRKGMIEPYDVYEFGLDVSLCAGDILEISSEEINFLYTNLKIKCIIDIDVSNDEVCSIMGIKPGKELGYILKKLESEIINGNLDNSHDKIIEKLTEWGE